MRLSDVKQWILSLASASVLTQMVFAQAAPAPLVGQQIILVQGDDKAAPAPAAQAPAPDAKVAAPDAAPANGNGNGNGEEKKDEGPWRLFPDEVAGFKITGWLYGTGVYNSSNGGGTRYNGPMSMSDQEGVF